MQRESLNVMVRPWNPTPVPITVYRCALYVDSSDEAYAHVQDLEDPAEQDLARTQHLALQDVAYVGLPFGKSLPAGLHQDRLIGTDVAMSVVNSMTLGIEPHRDFRTHASKEDQCHCSTADLLSLL